MVQDYHLFLVPRMLRDAASRPAHRALHAHAVGAAGLLRDAARRRRAARSSTACSAPTSSASTPQRWADLFRDTCRADRRRRTPDGVRVFPLGTDADEMHKRAAGATSTARCACCDGRRRRPAGHRPRRPHRAVEERLARAARLPRAAAHPPRVARQGRARASTTTRPARTCRPTASTPRRIERLADEIDDEFSTDEWTPLMLEIDDDYPAALAVLRRSDVAVRQLGARRHEPRRARRARAVRARPGRRPLARDRRGRGARRRRDHGQPVRRHRHAPRHCTRRCSCRTTSAPTRAERMRAAAVRLPPAEWFQAQLDALAADDQAAERDRSSSTDGAAGSATADVGRPRRPPSRRRTTAPPTLYAACAGVASARDLGERRHVAEVVAEVEHGRVAAAADEPGQRARLVEAGQPQLEHRLARDALRGRARRPGRATGSCSAASAPSGSSARRACTTSESRLSSIHTSGSPAASSRTAGSAVRRTPIDRRGCRACVSSPSRQVSTPYSPATIRPGTASRPPSRSTVCGVPPGDRPRPAPRRAARAVEHVDRTRRPAAILRVADERRERAVEVGGDQGARQDGASEADRARRRPLLHPAPPD